jgi:putative Mg2+ transporter-C (MgtC) family protein
MQGLFEIGEADIEMLLRLCAALASGALIGYERSFHGRPAGLRTHVLVCLASSLLMLITVYESHWVLTAPGEIRMDPTRMAQGIMTGIGFLGAGVVVKEGLNVRGLTTAASIWITSAIGILAGVGMYVPMTISVLMTLAVLSLFRWIEAKVPTQTYFNFDVKYEKAGDLSEDQLRELIEKHKFSIADFSYRLETEGRVLRHSMTLRTTDRTAAKRLATALRDNPTVFEFKLSPTSDRN